MSALAGRLVVVTRPRGRGAELARALRSSGARVLSVPLLRIEPRPLAARLQQYDWVVLTSVNGVRSVAARLERGAPRVAALGPATARALLRWGVRPNLVARTPTAEGLARALARELRGARARVLHPTSDRTRPVLREALVRAGHRVTELVVYRTVAAAPPRAALRRRVAQADAVVVCSPSAVERLHAQRLLGPRARLACIGPVTAGAARRLGMRVGAVAARPTARSLAAAVSRALVGPR